MVTSGESLDQSLQRTDVEIKRTGRINRREIKEMLEDVKQWSKYTQTHIPTNYNNTLQGNHLMK